MMAAYLLSVGGIKGLRINRRKMLQWNWHQNILLGKIECFECKLVYIFNIYNLLLDKFPVKQ
jgi:hypothetical protein